MTRARLHGAASLVDIMDDPCKDCAQLCTVRLSAERHFFWWGKMRVCTARTCQLFEKLTVEALELHVANNRRSWKGPQRKQRTTQEKTAMPNERKQRVIWDIT